MSDWVYLTLGIFYTLVIILMLGGAFVFFSDSAKKKRAEYHKQWKRRHLKVVRSANDSSKKRD